MATELEIIVHAKQYLDKLANGINPLTDEQLAETRYFSEKGDGGAFIGSAI